MDENEKDEKSEKDSSGEPKKKKRSEIKLGELIYFLIYKHINIVT